MPLHLKPHRKRALRKTTFANGKMIEKDSFLVQLQGVYDRTAAQKLKGATLCYATQQDTVVKDDDEVIVSDLVGLDVYTLSSDENQEPTLVGHVQGVVLAEDLCDIPWLLHDQIEVALACGNDSPRPGRRPQDLVLIPLVPEIVPKIDLEGNMILVDPPAGSLDLLTYVREEKVRIKGLLAPTRED
jgi:ribosomal 30S subunit maturation factor RimM